MFKRMCQYPHQVQNPITEPGFDAAYHKHCTLCYNLLREETQIVLERLRDCRILSMYFPPYPFANAQPTWGKCTQRHAALISEYKCTLPIIDPANVTELIEKLETTKLIGIVIPGLYCGV
jgi:hypothetical protein